MYHASYRCFCLTSVSFRSARTTAMGSMKCDEAFEIVDGDLVEGYYETTGLDDVGQLGQDGGEGEVMYYYVDEPSVSEQILPPESENTMEIDVVDLPEEK